MSLAVESPNGGFPSAWYPDSCFQAAGFQSYPLLPDENQSIDDLINSNEPDCHKVFICLKHGTTSIRGIDYLEELLWQQAEMLEQHVLQEILIGLIQFRPNCMFIKDFLYVKGASPWFLSALQELNANHQISQDARQTLTSFLAECRKTSKKPAVEMPPVQITLQQVTLPQASQLTCEQLKKECATLRRQNPEEPLLETYKKRAETLLASRLSPSELSDLAEVVASLAARLPALSNTFNTLSNEYASLRIEDIFKRDDRKIFARLRQLAPMGRKCELDFVELFQLAVFIQTSLAKFPHTKLEHFKKASSKSYRLPTYPIPRTIAHEPKSDRVFILLKDSFSFHKEGSTKKVTAAIELRPLTNPSPRARLVAHLVTKDTQHKKLHHARDEDEIWSLLKGMPGIWNKIASGPAIKEKNGKLIGKYEFFADLGESLTRHWSAACSFQQIVSIARQLIAGVQSAHSSGVLHNDLKLDNALARKKRDGSVHAGWLDFGLSKHASCDKSHYQDGWYGSYHFTPPEIFDNKAFQGDPHTVEVWALGFNLFTGIKGRKPNWTHLLNYFYLKRKDPFIPRYFQIEFEKLWQQEIQMPCAMLLEAQKTRPLTPEEDLDLLVYRMLSYNPADRISIDEAARLIGSESFF